MFLQGAVAFKILDVYKIKREERRGSTGARPWAAIAFRISGGSRFESLGKTYEADASSVIYIPEGVSFSRRGSAEELVIIHLKIFDADHKEIEVFKSGSPTTCENEFTSLYLEWISGKAGYRHRCASILSGILAELSAATEVGGANKYPLIKKGEELLDRSYSDPQITVRKLAEACSVSPEYFRALYKSAHGVSPHKKIEELRLARAKRLLEAGDFSISEISEECGFRNTKYFTALFTKRVGVCPRDYKKAYNPSL